MVVPEMALSVVIPVYNEQNSILIVVASLDQTLTALGLPYEIIRWMMAPPTRRRKKCGSFRPASRTW
jgi:hypothetical protein